MIRSAAVGIFSKDLWHHRLEWEAIDPGWLARLVEMARDEDLAGGGLRQRAAVIGDATSALMWGGQKVPAVEAALVAREPLVFAGQGIVSHVLAAYGGTLVVRWQRQDGEYVQAGEVLGEISGPADALLSAERVVLNFLQFLSGVATATRRLVNELQGSQPRLLDTRKTHPVYRMLLKYAVGQGGGWNHRCGLFDRIMLKDNHFAFFGGAAERSIAEAVESARHSRPDLPVEVEVDKLAQVEQAALAAPDVILFDNFTPEMLRRAVEVVDQRCLTEASGGINARNLTNYRIDGLDFISTGATVHAARWVDIGLDANCYLSP